MAKLADAADLKSAGAYPPWGFKSPSGHQLNICIINKIRTLVSFVPKMCPKRGCGFGYMKILGMMRGGFCNVQRDAGRDFAEGEKIAARFTTGGTREGPFFGVPATGKKIEECAMTFYRFAEGSFVEEYDQPDLLGFVQQIGAIPKQYAIPIAR